MSKGVGSELARMLGEAKGGLAGKEGAAVLKPLKKSGYLACAWSL